MFQPGERIGDYEIVTKLKSGGMATLFLARRSGASGFAKHVAIKVVHPHLAEDPQFVRMFVDEALLSARIDHPNVVHVEELREINGRHFLVMEYVNGCSLSQLMRELARHKRRATPQLAVHVAGRIADGLHAAHELRDERGELLGVVHRDVSPQNVLLTWHGHIKVIDFGVAKARSRSHQTTGASLKGKLRYMSPEQAFGRPVDRRSDVYSLGILLWEMLTMRRCFDAEDDFALLDQVREPRVRPPSELVPDIPETLDRVVMTALAPDVEQRYATAQQMRRELVGALPSSVTFDASHLGELLQLLMGDRVTKSRLALPESFSGEVPEKPGDAEEALKTMTISQTELASFVDFPSGDASSRGASAGAADAGAPPAEPVFPAGTPSRSPEPRSVSTLVIGAALLALMAAGAIGGWVLFGRSRNEPVVIRLDDPAGAAPDAQVAAPPEPATASAALPTDVAPARDAGTPTPTEPDAGHASIRPARAEREQREQRQQREPRVRRPHHPPRTAEMHEAPAAMGGVPIADEFGF